MKRQRSFRRTGISILAGTATAVAFGLTASPAMALDLDLGGIAKVKVAEPNKLVDVEVPVVKTKVSVDAGSSGAKANVSVGDTAGVKVDTGSGGGGAKVEVKVGSGSGSGANVSVDAGTGGKPSGGSTSGGGLPVVSGGGGGGVKPITVKPITVQPGKAKPVTAKPVKVKPGTHANPKTSTDANAGVTVGVGGSSGGNFSDASVGGYGATGSAGSAVRTPSTAGKQAQGTTKAATPGAKTATGSGVTVHPQTDVEIATPADSATLAVAGDALRSGQGHSPTFWALWLLAAATAGGLLSTIGSRARRRHQATMLQRRMDALAAELEPEEEFERELVNS